MKVAYSSTTVATDRTRNVAVRSINPALVWGIIGALLLAMEFYVVGKWILSPYFVPTDPGPDPLPQSTWYLLRTMEVISTTSIFAMTWFLVIKPWRRDGRPSLDGILVVVWMNLFFQDPFLNYTSTQYYINSHLYNFGSWTLGAMPGWTSPNGNLLPEPLLLWFGAYGWFGFLPCLAACFGMRKYKEKFPRASVLELILVAWAIMFCIDMVGEATMIRGGIYAYPGHIKEITLWEGETYQFPLNESFFMGAVMAATACLRYFVNDRGETLVERGIERLKFSNTQQHLLRFLAVYGWVHLGMWVLYNIPQQWVGTHTDPFPANYPSYLSNHMCVSGNSGNQCPGPGVAMPRP